MHKPLWLTLTQRLSLWAAYQVATLVKVQVLESDDGSGRDSSEGIFLSLGLIVRWLLAVIPLQQIIYTFHSR